MSSHGDGGEEGPRAGWRGQGGGGGGLGGVVSPGAGAGRLQPGREPPLLRVRPARGHLRGYHRGQLCLHHLLRPLVSGPARGEHGGEDPERSGGESALGTSGFRAKGQSRGRAGAARWPETRRTC